MSKETKHIVIVGGGAAGMMAAATILEKSSEVQVTLVEKNTKLGRKVCISGGGRCNVTTGNRDMKDVLKNYPRGYRFLKHAFYTFSPEDVYEWFEDHGVPLKIEKDMRVFPVSNIGEDIVDVFRKIFEEKSCTLMLGVAVSKVEKEKQIFHITLGNGEVLQADALILTTGGQAYRHTGSTGDGYTFAESLGHTITALAPSLHSFIIQEPWVGNLAGVSLKGVLTIKGKEKYSFRGPFICTHKGISGPAVFAISSLAAFEPIAKDQPLSLSLDLVPDLSHEELLVQLQYEKDHQPKLFFKKVIARYIPKSVTDVVLSNIIGKEDIICGEVSKKDMNKVRDWLKNAPLTIIGRGKGDEFVTAGGVSLSEVDPQTMQSRLCPGLYFAGELLDVDGFTGGYNLQASWAAGRLAGLSVVEERLHIS